MNKTNAIVESRKRKIQELTDEFEGVRRGEILRDGIEELVEKEIKEIEKGILSQYSNIAMTISIVNFCTFIVFREITKRVINKWKR